VVYALDVADASQEQRPVHPNSLANLKPYPPGVSGNPGGRPRGASIVAPLLAELAEGAEFGEGVDDEGKPCVVVTKYGDKAVALARNWLKLANGDATPSNFDTKALLAIVERADGPMANRIEHSGTLEHVARVHIVGIDDPEVSE
jgi:hypothetical protein